MRADGKRLKHTDPMYTVAAYIMDKRYDAMNMITLDIPVDPIQSYINEKRKQGIIMSHMDVIIAAYLRTAASYPALNRFVVNRKVYTRNEFCIAMVVLKPGDMNQETMSKMYFSPDYTIFQVHDTIEKYVTENREAPEKNGTEKIIKFLLSFPGVLPIGVGIFKFMDKHGLLPKSIIDASPFHSSMVVSNLASIRTNHIYHHCYEFGTTSLVLTMGNLREVAKRKGDDIVFERCIPIGLVMDERICSGAYFSMAFRELKKYLKNPKLLETPPEKVLTDPEL
ncbi:MAG: 2-oxo acid dehydrogenase subunit E2 [Ruminococcaceae bacterium]|nr:2-oxo acid dehydrogenase subunit E2 [Oscillospiraceae bacterium]